MERETRTIIYGLQLKVVRTVQLNGIMAKTQNISKCSKCGNNEHPHLNHLSQCLSFPFSLPQQETAFKARDHSARGNLIRMRALGNILWQETEEGAEVSRVEGKK